MAGAINKLRVGLWAVVAVVALAATGLYVYSTNRPVALATTMGAGDYQLVTAAGEPFSRDSFNGHPSALFFGFTHCPDVCPTTLAEMTAWYQTLGADAKDLKAYFVSVDPERDTPEVLQSYLGWTDVVTGVTGSVEEMAKATKSWAVYSAKVPLDDGGYTMDHTASVFLLDRTGNFQGTIAYGESSDTAIAKLRRLIER
jgi:protein SCO1/2